MKQEDYQRFRDGIEGVYSFYGKDINGFSMDVWWAALKAFDIAAVVDAFNRHLMNPDSGQWLPKPADIVRMLGGRTVDSAQKAWTKVDTAVRCVGTYQTVVFDDPLIHRVVTDMGGWIALGSKGENDWPFVAKEFETRYRGYAMRGERPAHPAALIGQAEAHNALKGLQVDPPRLIGDEEQARRVMLSGSDVALIGPAGKLLEKGLLSSVSCGNG